MRDRSRHHLSQVIGSVVVVVLLAACTSAPVAMPTQRTATVTPVVRPTNTSAPVATPTQRAATVTPAVVPTNTLAPTATPQPTETPTPVGNLTPTIAPGTTAEIDCADVAPFAPGCLDQPRPPGLASDVSFVGILPAGPVQAAAWSPYGTYLAYAVANPETGAFQGIEVRSLPDFRLEGRWAVRGIFGNLTWTNERAVLFIFDRGDTSSIGLARLGEAEWHDLLPGGKAVLAVSMGKDFVDWLGENVLAFRVHCGTGCETLYSLDIATGNLRPLVNAWGEPDAPYADVFGTVYVFSPDHRWLAATSWGRGSPEAVALEWPGPAEPLDLSARLDGRWTEAQSWSGGFLAFVAYPSGDPDSWPSPLRPDLYIWDGETGVIRWLASGAFRAIFSPNQDRLAVLFMGEPRTNEEGQLEAEGHALHLGLLSWPQGRLLATHPVSTGGISNVFNLWRLPTPVWVRHGGALAFQPAGGGLALMTRDGDVWPILTGKVVNWVGWGGDNLALLVGEEVWLVRGSVRVRDTDTRPYTDAVLGMALDIPAEWEVHGFQGAEAHIVALDTTGRSQGVLTFSVVGAFDTLDSTLAEVRRGAWGLHIRNVRPVRLGEFEALRLELAPGEERPPVVWLLVTPSGVAVGFIPDNDLALVEPVLATLRAVPVREPWEAITPTPPTPDVEGARQALIAFFSLLHAQRYGEALHHYGGSYDILRDWNPDVSEDDYATLFQRGCTSNGLRCLKIRTIVREEQVSPTEFSFVVEFINDDGTLFARGSCWGNEEREPPQTQFCFTVKKVGDRFLVQDLPVYVP
jgi:hypothetical protein